MHLSGIGEDLRSMSSLLSLNIIDGTIVTVFSVASIAVLLYLLSRRMPARRVDDGLPSRRLHLRRWIRAVALSALGGMAVAVAIIVVSEVVLNLFGTPLELDTHAWVVASFAAVGVAVANIWTSRWWRKAVASVAILLFLGTATLGINASYGLNTTVASLLNIEVGRPLAIPKPSPSVTAIATIPPAPPKPLWQRWTAPPGMPAEGQYGTVTIPNTASGFVARPAYLYLPPAALVPNPPTAHPDHDDGATGWPGHQCQVPANPQFPRNSKQGSRRNRADYRPNREPRPKPALHRLSARQRAHVCHD